MGVHVIRSTTPGGVTPICSDCGVSLCWDIDEGQYAEEKAFWDAWVCKDCNPSFHGALKRWRAHNLTTLDKTYKI